MEDKILKKMGYIVRHDGKTENCGGDFMCGICPLSYRVNDDKTRCIERDREENLSIAQNYIKEHEKTVDTINSIEEQTITLGDLKDIKENNIVPTYYHKGNYDVIQFCNDNNIYFATGNIIKYITRYKDKNGIEDLKKAKEYINRSNGLEYEISLADVIHFNLENNLDYMQGKIIELVLDDELTQAINVLNDLIEKEEKKIREIEETYQAEGMAD